jgi:16S rRNA (uracil1498-N3)-methyltransferase
MRINSLVDAEELKREVVTLSSAESHHLARVLRIQSGQEITLFDGQGNVAEGCIETSSKTAVEVRVSSRVTVPPPAVQIDLVQAVPKPDRWDWVMQKAVELGVSNIIPILTQHTEFKPNEKKTARWQKIVLNAAQQCEIRWLPKLQALENFETMLSTFGKYDLVIIGSLYEGAKPFRTVPMEGITKVALLIGPEGDFRQDEVDRAVANGAIPVSFGERILRTETAAIFGLSVLAYELL